MLLCNGAFCVINILKKTSVVRRILSSVQLKQYGKHKPSFDPDSIIICVQNSIITILSNLIILF